MFVGARDSSEGLAVWLMYGPHNSDADYEAYVETIGQMRIEASRHPRPAAIMMIDPGNPVPDARWRRRIAEASADIPNTALFALVSESRVVQSVVTAVNWIRPPRYEHSVHTTFEQARSWVEDKRGESLPGLLMLLAETRADARAKSP